MESAKVAKISNRGVTLESVPGMKVIQDGRDSTSWSVEQHGFTFFEHKTALSLETFHSPHSGVQQHLFKFSGQSVLANGVDAQEASWTQDYSKEIAEACKRVLPSAEAAFVSYQILRKSDLSISNSKHAMSPRIKDSQVHKLASKILASLDSLDFEPVAGQEHSLRLLKGECGGPEEFVRKISATHISGLNSELQEQVIQVLSDDEHYAFLSKAKAELETLAHKRSDVLVKPKNPDSQAEQVVSQMLAQFQYLDLLPKSYKRSIGVKLHLEGPGGIESFLVEQVTNNSLPKSQNPYALMPDASPELQKEVLKLLRDDIDHFDFIARAQRLIPAPATEENESSADDAVNFQPPALGGGHTDCSAESYLDQFRAAIPEEHELGKPGPGKKRRVVFLKFWRNVADTPIMNHHLAVLDKSSLMDSDIYEGELNFKGYSIKQNRMNNNVDEDKLKWVYFPKMQRDEVLCFQQGDLTMSNMGAGAPHIAFPIGKPDHATFHGAFEDPTAPADVPPRQSIEAAAFVFLPEEQVNLSKL